MVAALGDLEVGEVARRGEHARREVVIEVEGDDIGASVDSMRLRKPHDLLDFVGADQRIDFGQLRRRISLR
jgi:hypothetical protein